MRKIFLFMLVSVDGYFEGPNHDISWHNVDKEFVEFADKQMVDDVGTLLFGHRTYDLMASYWPTDHSPTAQLMNATQKIVVTHAPFAPRWENVTVIAANDTKTSVADEIRALKEQPGPEPGKDIAIFGSNALCVSLMEAGLVDEFRIMVCPVALGKGTPLFAGLGARTKLRLVKTREFASGNLLQTYTVKQ